MFWIKILLLGSFIGLALQCRHCILRRFKRRRNRSPVLNSTGLVLIGYSEGTVSSPESALNSADNSPSTSPGVAHTQQASLPLENSALVQRPSGSASHLFPELPFDPAPPLWRHREVSTASPSSGSYEPNYSLSQFSSFIVQGLQLRKEGATSHPNQQALVEVDEKQQTFQTNQNQEEFVEEDPDPKRKPLPLNLNPLRKKRPSGSVYRHRSNLRKTFHRNYAPYLRTLSSTTSLPHPSTLQQSDAEDSQFTGALAKPLDYSKRASAEEYSADNVPEESHPFFDENKKPPKVSWNKLNWRASRRYLPQNNLNEDEIQKLWDVVEEPSRPLNEEEENEWYQDMTDYIKHSKFEANANAILDIVKRNYTEQGLPVPELPVIPQQVKKPNSIFVRALASSAARRQRGEKKPIPDEQKDDRYFERRKRNNLAAKKSRDNRKRREDQIAIRASLLEKENAILRAQVATLREEAVSLRQLILQKKPHYFKSIMNDVF